MTAPAYGSPRTRPTGKQLTNGFRSLLAFSANLALNIWEIEATPSGMDAGDKIKTTTMWNDDVETYEPRALYDYTDGKLTFSYDPLCRTEIKAMIGRRQTITQIYPDGTTESSFGRIAKVDFKAHKNGDQPQGELTWDNLNTDTTSVEAAPILVPVAGT